jgi:hypothetical protein
MDRHQLIPNIRIFQQRSPLPIDFKPGNSNGPAGKHQADQSGRSARSRNTVASVRLSLNYGDLAKFENNVSLFLVSGRIFSPFLFLWTEEIPARLARQIALHPTNTLNDTVFALSIPVSVSFKSSLTFALTFALTKCGHTFIVCVSPPSGVRTLVRSKGMGAYFTAYHAAHHTANLLIAEDASHP